jgi:hypothetical protein
MERIRRIAAALGAAILLAAAAAHAGRTCEARPLDVESVRQAMELAARTARRLDESKANVVVLARAGQDLTRYGLTWSHMGFAYREREGGPWRVAHKSEPLRHRFERAIPPGPGRVLHGPLCSATRRGFVVLDAEAQARLLPVLRDNYAVSRWHAEPYSMVAYPWSLRYQQSNQWGAGDSRGRDGSGITTRSQAQAWLQLRDYRPAVLHLGAMERLGARITTAHIAFDDHPDIKRFSGRIETVSVDSAFAWLKRSGLGGAVVASREAALAGLRVRCGEFFPGSPRREVVRSVHGRRSRALLGRVLGLEQRHALVQPPHVAIHLGEGDVGVERLQHHDDDRHQQQQGRRIRDPQRAADHVDETRPEREGERREARPGSRTFPGGCRCGRAGRGRGSRRRAGSRSPGR